MVRIDWWLYVAAAICFLLATCNATWPKVNFVPLGFLLLTLTLLTP